MRRVPWTMFRGRTSWVLRSKVAVFVGMHQKNVLLREQEALLRTAAATDLLTQLSTRLCDVEAQARDLTGQLQAQALSATVRTTAARLERAIRSLRQVLQGALELQEEPGAPASQHSPGHHRDQ